jgi:hypothetical protein
MHFKGYHRSGNGQEKKFFKVREKSGESCESGKTDILKESQEN